jgi:hypothetical protein
MARYTRNATERTRRRRRPRVRVRVTEPSVRALRVPSGSRRWPPAAGVAHEINKRCTAFLPIWNGDRRGRREAGGAPTGRSREVIDMLLESRQGPERLGAIVPALSIFALCLRAAGHRRCECSAGALARPRPPPAAAWRAGHAGRAWPDAGASRPASLPRTSPTTVADRLPRLPANGCQNRGPMIKGVTATRLMDGLRFRR